MKRKIDTIEIDNDKTKSNERKNLFALKIVNGNNNIIFKNAVEYEKKKGELNNSFKVYEYIEKSDFCRLYVELNVKKLEYPHYFDKLDSGVTHKLINFYIKEICSILLECTAADSKDLEVEIYDETSTDQSFLIFVKNWYMKRNKMEDLIQNIKKYINKALLKFNNIINISKYNTEKHYHDISNISNITKIISRQKDDKKIKEKGMKKSGFLKVEIYNEIDQLTKNNNKLNTIKTLLNENFRYNKYYRGEYIFDKVNLSCFICNNHNCGGLNVYLNQYSKLECSCKTLKNMKVSLEGSEFSIKTKEVLNMDLIDIDKITSSVYEEENMRPYDLNRYDTVVVKANMGIGKTKELIQTLKNGLLKNISTPTQYKNEGNYIVICLTARKTQIEEMREKFNKHFITSTYLEGIDLNKYTFNLVQLESIYKYESHLTGKNIILVLDESETILSNVDSGIY